LLLIIIFLFVFVIFLPKIVDNYSSTRNLRSISTAFFFTIFNMASISGYFSWLETGNFFVQLGLFLFSLVIVWLLLGMEKNRDILFFILAFFLGNSLLLIPPQKNTSINSYLPSDSIEENKMLNLVKGKRLQFTPNIYLLVYDAYVSNETLTFYGIDNSDQEKFLEDQGFVVYSKIYSVGSSTLSTMNKVLNVSLDNYGHIRRGVAGDGIVQKILKENNYRVIGIFPYDYMFWAIGPMYDNYFPEKVITPYKLLLSGILMGEFRFDIGLKSVDHKEFVSYKQDFFEQKHIDSFFVYSHSNLPDHSQNSGKCLQNEIDLYRNRLVGANQEMKEDVSIILKNDPEAIVIIAGDHGPYLTKNCSSTNGVYSISDISRTDIQDRFGAFLAIKWPNDNYEYYDDIVVLQDLFPSILSYIYQDTSILQSKIEPRIMDIETISGVSVMDGIIIGGIDDGEPLFNNSSLSD